MKNIDMGTRYDWGCFLLLTLLLLPPLLFIEQLTLPVITDGVLWYVGVAAAVIAVFTIAFSLLYGALLLCFPKKKLRNLKGSDFKASSVNSKQSEIRSKPISNPYERVENY
jgi:hypothetical protein